MTIKFEGLNAVTLDVPYKTYTFWYTAADGREMTFSTDGYKAKGHELRLHSSMPRRQIVSYVVVSEEIRERAWKACKNAILQTGERLCDIA